MVSNSKQSDANLIGNSISWTKELYSSASGYSLQISTEWDCKFKANCNGVCQNCFAHFPVVSSLEKAWDLNWVAKSNNPYQMYALNCLQ